MSEPFLSEIKIVGFNFAPRGWAFCDGQILPINQYQSLYSLLGTVYGGDGRTTFGLPEMRGRTPVSPGANGVVQGTKTGAENVFLTEAEMAGHDHSLEGTTNAGSQPIAIGNVLATAPATGNFYASSGANNIEMSTFSVSGVGGNQSHTNMQPYLALNYCIALQGVFPSRN